MSKRTRERKSFDLELKELNDSGSFVGLASTYGNKDQQGDVCVTGCFTKTLQERGARIPVLWAHNQEQPIGYGDLTDTPHGLQIKGQLCLDVAKAKEIYALMKAGVVKSLSIGFDTVKQSYKDSTRLLTELRLWEISCVLFPANEEAAIVGVKTDLPGDPSDEASEEAAELIAYQTLNTLLTQANTALAAMRAHVTALIDAETEFPTETPQAEDAEEEQEEARLEAVNALASQVIGAIFGVQGVVFSCLADEAEDDVTAAGYMSARGPEGRKAGARHSRTDQAHLQAAHDHTVSAGATCATDDTAKSHTPGTSAPEAAPAQDNPELLQLLRARTDALRVRPHRSSTDGRKGSQGDRP